MPPRFAAGTRTLDHFSLGWMAAAWKQTESSPSGIIACTFINVVRVNYTHHYLLVLSGGELISHQRGVFIVKLSVTASQLMHKTIK